MKKADFEKIVLDSIVSLTGATEVTHHLDSYNINNGDKPASEKMVINAIQAAFDKVNAGLVVELDEEWGGKVYWEKTKKNYVILIILVSTINLSKGGKLSTTSIQFNYK